jgi:hypothetical protein
MTRAARLASASATSTIVPSKKLRLVDADDGRVLDELSMSSPELATGSASASAPSWVTSFTAS